MTLHSSSSHRSGGESGASSLPDPLVTMPLRRGSRRVLIRPSWVRACGTSTDPQAVESAVMARPLRPPDRRAA